MPKRYVVTGAPGAGKTSLLRALQERHWSVVEEAATDVIAREQATGRDEPWADSDFISRSQRSSGSDSSVQPMSMCSSTTAHRCAPSRSRCSCSSRCREH